MNGEIPYKAVEYGNGNGDEIVALVAGFGSKPGELDQAGRDLADSGRNAVVYTYHPRILLAGDAELLPGFAETLNEDFQARAIDYQLRRYCGASLGGAIAADMQKKDESPERGLYAATGADAARLVMRNGMFRAIILATHYVDVRRAYEKNGYTLPDLQDRWHDLCTPPATPLTIALGGLDYIVRQREMIPRIAAWRATGHDVRTIYRPRSGHTGTIKWLNEHVMDMLDPDPADSAHLYLSPLGE